MTKGPMSAELAVLRVIREAGPGGISVQEIRRRVDRSLNRTQRIVLMLKLEGLVESAGRRGRTPLWRILKGETT